jgi:hypothetical protein
VLVPAGGVLLHEGLDLGDLARNPRSQVFAPGFHDQDPVSDPDAEVLPRENSIDIAGKDMTRLKGQVFGHVAAAGIMGSSAAATSRKASSDRKGVQIALACAASRLGIVVNRSYL